MLLIKELLIRSTLTFTAFKQTTLKIKVRLLKITRVMNYFYQTITQTPFPEQTPKQLHLSTDVKLTRRTAVAKRSLTQT